MNHEQIIEAIRTITDGLPLTYRQGCALAWCVAKLMKASNDVRPPLVRTMDTRTNDVF